MLLWYRISGRLIGGCLGRSRRKYRLHFRICGWPLFIVGDISKRRPGIWLRIAASKQLERAPTQDILSQNTCNDKSENRQYPIHSRGSWRQGGGWQGLNPRRQRKRQPSSSHWLFRFFVGRLWH
jgi:hypothetical protein